MKIRSVGRDGGRPRLVAYDEYGRSRGGQVRDALPRARERRRIDDPLAVDDCLQPLPIVLATGTAAKRIAQCRPLARTRRFRPAELGGDANEELIVVDERVVEIDGDTERPSGRDGDARSTA